MAMGWLDWASPEIAMNTNVNVLEIAIRGKVDFVKKTNPFGSKEESEEEKLLKEPPNPQAAMTSLINMAKRRQASNNRSKPKGKN